MNDVSSTIIVGEWTLTPLADLVRVSIGGWTGWWLTDQQARDLAQALQVWIERSAGTEA